MGRIKTTMIKKTSKQLLQPGDSNFTEDFEHNKKLLGSTMPSKSTRNKIAGYIARLIRMQKEEKEADQKTTAPSVKAE